MDHSISFIVPKNLVKTFKSALEKQNLLNKSTKIAPASSAETHEESRSDEMGKHQDWMRLPTNIHVIKTGQGTFTDGSGSNVTVTDLLERLGLNNIDAMRGSTVSMVAT